MWKWFAERILPALALAVIFGVGGWFVGVKSQIIDGVVGAYFPAGTILLVGEKFECPNGWEKMPRTAIMAEKVHVAEFTRKLGGSSSNHPSLEPWSFYHPVVCIKN